MGLIQVRVRRKSERKIQGERVGRRAQARGAGCRWRMCNIFNMCIYIWPSFHFSSTLWRLLIASQLGCNLIRCNSLCFFFITSHFAFETVLCLFSLMFKCAACNQLRQINHCRESERQFYQKQNFIRIETTATTCRTTIANCLLASSSSRYFFWYFIWGDARVLRAIVSQRNPKQYWAKLTAQLAEKRLWQQQQQLKYTQSGRETCQQIIYYIVGVLKVRKSNETIFKKEIKRNRKTEKWKQKQQQQQKMNNKNRRYFVVAFSMINISKKVSSPNFHFIFDLLVFEYVFCVNKPSSDVKHALLSDESHWTLWRI